LQKDHGRLVFAVLGHLWSLMCRPLMLLSFGGGGEQSLASLVHPSWVRTIHSYGKRGDIVLPWATPIAHYTQSQTRFAATFLSQHLNTLSEDCMAEFRAVFEALWLRVVVLCQECYSESVLDESDMRMDAGAAGEGIFIVGEAYYQFCHCYLGGIFRALFYHDEVRKRPVAALLAHGEVEGTRAWITQIVTGMATEAFEEMYDA